MNWNLVPQDALLPSEVGTDTANHIDEWLNSPGLQPPR